MIFTLIALAALLAPPALHTDVATADPAALLPANTIFYVGTPSLAAGAEMAKNSAMRKILDEPEVKAFLQKPVGAADKALSDLIAKSGLPQEATPKVTLAGMLGGEQSAVPITRFFLALTHVTLPSPDSAGSGEPDVGLVLGIEMQNEADLGLVKALWSMVPAMETTATHGGRSYMLKKTEGGPTLVLGFLDKLAVLSLSEKTLHTVMDNAGAATGASLADTAEYKQASTLGGGMRPDSSTWMFRVGLLADMARSLLSIAMLNHSDDHPDIQKVSGVLDELGLDSIHWMGGEGHREADGRVISTMGVSTASDPKGLIGKCVSSNAPIDLAMLSGVPGNCLSMSAFSVDWVPHVYDFLLSTFEAFAPDEAAMVKGQIDAFMGGASLREDILANPQGVLLSYAVPGEGFPGTPSSIFRVKLRNPEKFVGAMKSLAGGIASEFPDFKGLKITDSTHEGRAFYEIDLSSTPGALIMLQPAFALDGDSLVMCLQSSKSLKTALNGLQGAGSLADNSELMTFAKGLAAKGTLMELSFSDDAKTFGTVYGQLAPAIGMMSGMFGQLPVDFSLMPTEQAIGKHLGYNFSGSYKEAGGLDVHRSVSEFALGDFVPLALTAGVIAVDVISSGGMYESDEAQPEASPTEHVQNDLSQLSAAMTVYKISQGSYPTDLSELVKPLPDYEEGCLGKPDLPVDPWGNGYHFRLNEKKKPFLWSAGPNMVDEGGGGDDIAKK